jgi:predicted kinase
MTPPPTLILIAGGPGAGKTALGREIARIVPTAMLLDKDVLGSIWVDAMLEHLNKGQVDRDSKVYWDSVRPLEYSALLATALDNLGLGKTVIAVAPFGPELRDAEWVRKLARSVQDLGARMRTIWIETDLQTARQRMVARNDIRDRWKLAHWGEFSAGAQFSAPNEAAFILRNTGSISLSDLVKQAMDHVQSK